MCIITTSLINSIAAHLRQYVGSRRTAPRRQVQRPANLRFTASRIDTRKAAAATAPLTFQGHTRDISETGLALLIPGLESREHPFAEQTLLEVKLELPGAPIMMYARPVRYEPLGLAKESGKKGALVCVKITGMRDRDREYYTRYLHRIGKRRLCK